MNKNNNFLVYALVVIILGAGVWFFLKGQKTATPDTMMTEESTTENQLVVSLNEENESGETGTATLTEENDQVTVILDMTGFEPDVSQPAHIHTGTCPDVAGVVYPLTNVLNGSSTTVLDVTLAQLKSELPLGLNVHKSAQEVAVYTACGDLVF